MLIYSPLYFEGIMQMMQNSKKMELGIIEY